MNTHLAVSIVSHLWDPNNRFSLIFVMLMLSPAGKCALLAIYFVSMWWPQNFCINAGQSNRLAKRQFTIDTGREKIPVEGHAHKNVAVKYLMRRRRSLLGTRDPKKVDTLYSSLPTNIKIIGKQLTHEYKINWARVGSAEFEGSRFVFTMDEEHLQNGDTIHNVPTVQTWSK